MKLHRGGFQLCVRMGNWPRRILFHFPDADFSFLICEIGTFFTFSFRACSLGSVVWCCELMLLLVPSHQQTILPRWRWWCHLHRLFGWAVQPSIRGFLGLSATPVRTLHHCITRQSDSFWRSTNGAIFDLAERRMSYSDNRWVPPPAPDKRLSSNSPLRQTGRQTTTLKSAAARKQFFSSPD